MKEVWQGCIWVLIVICVVQNMVLLSMVKSLTKGDKESVILYNKGFEAGNARGFQEGYRVYFTSFPTMHWVELNNNFVDKIEKHGSIHNTPWNEFNLQEKVFIAMFGGSGSKLNEEEIKEFVNLYAKKAL